jgi:hypothetical protein
MKLNKFNRVYKDFLKENWKNKLADVLNNPPAILKGIAAAGGYSMGHGDEAYIVPAQLDSTLNLLDGKATSPNAIPGVTYDATRKIITYDLNTGNNKNEFINALTSDDPSIVNMFKSKLTNLERNTSSKPYFTIQDIHTGRHMTVTRAPGGTSIIVRVRGL